MTDGKETMFRRVERLATQHMQHAYLARRHVKQAVSRFHFDVGYAILTAAGLPEEDIEKVLTAVLLVEQGLSIHDEVDSRPSDQQGLVVLAGDHNSSKYYYILAELGDSALMFALCDAVARVNEAKMTLLCDGHALSSAEYMRIMEIVEGQLLKSLATYYLGEHDAWMTYVESLVQAHIVKDELLARRANHNFSVRQASEWLTNSKQRVDTMGMNSPFGPIYSFLMEYVGPIQETVKHLHLAERNQ